MPRTSTASLEPKITFLNHRKVSFKGVKRAAYLFYQRFHYAYPGPIRDLQHRLVVVPAERYGDQQLCEHKLAVYPQNVGVDNILDNFGNRVLEFKAAELEREVSFEMLSTVERVVTPGHLPLASEVEANLFLHPTDLTEADERMLDVVPRLQGESRDKLSLANAINTWVYGVMRYGFGATGVRTTAAQALATGEGLCQDYAHTMLALCRAAGLRARYVSGHMLAEGGSHAWVEVLLPKGESEFEAVAFDPTNNRRPNLQYVTVAVGRDYRDVAPTSGSYSAPYAGELKITKQAGLTALEYADGRILGDAGQLTG